MNNLSVTNDDLEFSKDDGLNKNNSKVSLYASNSDTADQVQLAVDVARQISLKTL